MLVDLDVSRLAWVLEYVAEMSDGTDTDDDGHPNVVSAARELIAELKEELVVNDMAVAEVDAMLQKSRPLRGPQNLWHEPVTA